MVAALAERPVVVTALLTIWVMGAEVAGLRFASPGNTAVMVWVPGLRGRLKVTMPVGAEPPESNVAPSMMLSMALSEVGLMVAVKVTQSGLVMGFALEVMFTVGLPLFTTWFTAGEVLPLKPAVAL